MGQPPPSTNTTLEGTLSVMGQPPPSTNTTLEGTLSVMGQPPPSTNTTLEGTLSVMGQHLAVPPPDIYTCGKDNKISSPGTNSLCTEPYTIVEDLRINRESFLLTLT